MKVLVGILVCLILGTILVSVCVAQPIDRTFGAESYNSNIEAPMVLLSANAKNIFWGNFSFGAVYPGAIIEAGVSIPAIKVYSCESSSWIEILDIEENIHRTYGNFSNVEFSIKPKITSGQVLGDITLVTNEGTFCIGITGEVRSYPISRINLLIAETPFDALPGSENSRLKRMIESNNINVSYTFKLPGNIDSFDTIIIGQCCLVEGCRECLNTNEIRRLKDFVRNGGTLIIFADYYFRGTVDGANKIIKDFGLRMEDRWYYEEISVDKNNIATDPITKNIDDVVFWHPTPIFVDSSSNAKILVRNPERSDEGFVAVSRNEGTIYVVAESLYWCFLRGGRFQEKGDNTELLVNMIVSAKQPSPTLFENPGFESGELGPWYSRCAIQYSDYEKCEWFDGGVDRKARYEGEYGAFLDVLCSRKACAGIAQEPIGITPGDNLAVEAKLKYEKDLNDGFAELRLVFLDEELKYVHAVRKEYYKSDFGAEDKWISAVLPTATAPSNAMYVRVVVNMVNVKNCRLNIDNVILSSTLTPFLPSPTVSSGPSSIWMLVGEFKDVTFRVSNRGGESDTESYLSVSVSSGLQIEEWSSSSSDMNFVHSPADSEIVNSVGKKIISEYELLDAYEPYSAGETNTVTIKVKATTTGTQWIKYRTAFDTVESGYVFIRDPTSGQIDQQGWHVYEIPVSTGTPEEEYTFVTLWPELPQPWYFRGPEGIAVDSSGNVFVADSGNDRIQKFDSYGDFITKWGCEGTGDGEFDNPGGIAVDSSGNVFVSDNSRIQKFDSDGNFITKWGSRGTGDGEFKGPNGIAVDSSGNVFVADEYNQRIQKFDSDGNFITKWGCVDTGDGTFYYPMGIAVDGSGYVYVTDRPNERIHKFDSNGNFITKWGSEGTRDGEFDGPWGIAVDSRGNVFVAEYYNDRIQKFDTDGNFITKWGSSGWGDGEFSHLRGIAVDSRGNVFVAEDINRIQKFDSDGNFITKWGCLGSGDGEFCWPYGIAVDSSGYVFVADTYNNRIQKFDSDGNFITTYKGEFYYPYDIAVDNRGNVFVADTGNNRIQKFDSDGNFITQWSGYGTGYFYAPQGIAVDSNSNVYVADTGNSQIYNFDSDGNFITLWGSEGTEDGEFLYPEGIAVDSSGYVYVTDQWNGRIQKFDSDGNFITQRSSYDTGSFYGRQGITVDKSGNVYVADANNDRIQKFDSDGSFITQWGNHGSEDGEFYEPLGIAVDSNGNVYVADTRNNRIQKFVPCIPEHPDWTFMVYMGADNSMKGDANMDVKEMEEAGSTDEVNIVYLLDKTNSNTVIYRITGDHESELKKEYSKNKNSGDPNTLKDFINWVGSNYPAQHYCLVLWDHGYGWKGVVMDETEKEDKITLEELKNALDTSKIDGFDVIGFDACLMGGVEVDYQIKENSDYIVHSEETIEKGGGWPYDEILKSLISNPGMDGRELSETIVDKYAGYYQDEYYKATVSAVDTSRLDTLIDKIDIFSTKLLDKLEEGKGGKISAVRDSTDYYARGISDPKVHNIFIDLYDFAEKIKEEFAEDDDLMDVSTDLMTAMDGENGVVIKHWSESHGEHREDSHGLSIYFTKEDSDFRKYDSKYDDIEFSKDTRWDDFLRGYLQMKVDAKCPNDLILVDLEGNTTDIDTTTLTVTKHLPPANDIKGDLLKASEQAE